MIPSLNSAPKTGAGRPGSPLSAGAEPNHYAIMRMLVRIRRLFRTASSGPWTRGALAMALVIATACGGNSTADTQQRLKVVTTSPLLADLVKNVGGHLVQVRPVVPPGADVHSFQSTPQDSIAVSGAGLIVTNGSGLDDFLIPMINGAARPETVHVVASEGLQSQPLTDEEPLRQTLGKPASPLRYQQDPHFWQNPTYTTHYVRQIRDGLARADGSNAETYQTNADQYIKELLALDREIEGILDQVPPGRRHLVTFHDAFGHFADRYGWRVSSLVANNAGEASPGAITSMLEQIREEGIPAVFAEPQFGSQVIGQAAQDAGVSVGTIYSDILDDRVGAYIDMMRFNANSLAEHLR